MTAKTDPALSALIKISKTVGRDITLVQGGGGNTSVKTSDNKYMFIKASGTALKEMDKDKGWRRIRLDPVLSLIKDTSLAKMNTTARETEVVNRLFLACDDRELSCDSTARPSVEAHLHALLDKYVIHLHPNAIGAYVNTKNNKKLLEKLFHNEKLPHLWVPYTDPGLMLAKSIYKLVKDYQNKYNKKPGILFLEKHGLFVSANSAKSALEIVSKTVKICSRKLNLTSKKKSRISVNNNTINEAKLCIRKAFFQATGQYTCLNFFLDETIAGIMKQIACSKNPNRILAPLPITPDELVYANGPAMWVPQCNSQAVFQKLKKQVNSNQKPALGFLVKDLGLFIADKEKTASVIKDILNSSLGIRIQASKLGGLVCLNKRQADFIANWEAEAFRKTLAGAASAGSLELKNRIAVVTGAGSGLGRSIAVGLARAGAMVGLADIDQKAALQTAELIATELPSSSTLVLGCNVTNEDDIDNVFEYLINNWGGLDILVNAAGVAPAFALTDLPVDKWRFALEVNLTGYFLMARAAARIMIKQGMGGAIVNISSKSGIDASKNNTPYNATKAGELHMGRGWAMELGAHNIRVNSVCPGNVFEGSKIWNPKYIKICAKKYNIKPQEVIPYYVSKTMLNEEIKGQDIADAVVFLASDKARRITAQTMVVDGGQAMVR